SHSGVIEIASGDEIVGFDSDGSQVAWSARNGRQWSVESSNAAGQKRTIWSGTDSAGRPAFGQGRVLWTISRHGLVKGDPPLPALGMSLDLMALEDGGKT